MQVTDLNNTPMRGKRDAHTHQWLKEIKQRIIRFKGTGNVTLRVAEQYQRNQKELTLGKDYKIAFIVQA